MAAGITDRPMNRSFWGIVLTWGGALGSAISLFGSLQSLIDLAAWARWIVANYSYVVTTALNSFVSYLGFEFSAPTAIVLSWMLFTIGMGVGARLMSVSAPADESVSDAIKAVASAILMLIFGQTLFLGMAYFFYPLSLVSAPGQPSEFEIAIRSNPALYLTGAFPYYFSMLCGVIMWRKASREDIFFLNLFVVCSLVLLVPSFGHVSFSKGAELWVFVLARDLGSLAMPRLLLLIAPSFALNARFQYVLVGLLILLGLNWLSKLGLQMEPPAAT